MGLPKVLFIHLLHQCIISLQHVTIPLHTGLKIHALFLRSLEIPEESELTFSAHYRIQVIYITWTPTLEMF